MTAKSIEVKHNRVPAPANGNDIWQAFRQEVESVFDRFAGGLDAWKPFANIERLWPRNGFIPLAMDIDETDAAYTVSAELPGLAEKDVNVSVKGGALVIEGEKRQEKEEKGKDSYLSERSYGAFKRSFTLPDDVDAAKVNAAFAKGVLTVTLPKTAAAQTARKIEIKAA
ncbi:MAG TPA: Hsp20/alpha crystallin family protein [Rhizomicrobium sp.]|nr:Hsp20/alpha crystallin family protein [Rhizomicrobium sp.]